MAYHLDYDICSIFLLVLLIYLHLKKKKLSLYQNTFYTALIVATMLSSVFDIADVITTQYMNSLPLWLVEGTSYGYFLFHNSVPFFYALYTYALIYNNIFENSLGMKLALMVPYIIQLLVIFSTPFTKAAFYYDAFGYHRGLLQLPLYVICFYYASFGAVCCTLFKDVLNKNLRMSLYSFLFICLAASSFQIFYAEYLIENFAISFCLLMIYVNLQKPEELIHERTGALNDIAFSKSFLINAKTHRKNRLLFLCVEELQVLIHTFTLEKTLRLLSLVNNELEQISEQEVYYLENGAFAIMYQNRSPFTTEEILKKIDLAFTKSWHIDSVSIDLNFRTLELCLPDHSPDLDTLYFYLDYLQQLDNSKHWTLSADEISILDAERRQQVEAAVKWAIENDGFEMYFQPIYSTSKNAITSAEALIRLRTEALGFIPPDEFIALAEQNGSILKIGHIVFEKVFRFMSENSLEQMGIEYVEINLSMVQCMQEGLAEEVISLMEKYKIPGKSINLEITETAASTSPKMLIQNMELLSKHGITFSLDDFGTGYSNITSLLNLPLSIVKFDKSMIDMASRHNTGKIILDSSTAMIKQMNLNIVAEGIETITQKDDLIQSGIDYLQGYYFSRPVPGPEFIHFIKAFNESKTVSNS